MTAPATTLTMHGANERSYTTVEKSGWGEGPWSSEPDKLQWIDAVTGLDCLIVRGPRGALCGYVGVPPEHPWHRVHYSGSPEVGIALERQISVQEGLTYSDSCQVGVPESEAICHTPAAGRPENVWWFGSNCAGLSDYVPLEDREREPHVRDRERCGPAYRTVDYVKSECANLARQLAHLAAR
jgi:hypothetical protein